jgi:hypothetical protein
VCGVESCCGIFSPAAARGWVSKKRRYSVE